ncbi:MAG: FecR domain-containing protein [Burkholderiaceae bacterium]|nr:FecR domain-containing protein [Burkholderiaceae bacterium]
MTQPSPAADDPDQRELADFLAGQPALDAEAALWAARRQDGLDADEQAELEAWLAGDAARGARLRQLEAAWGRLDDLPADGLARLKTAAPADRGQGRARRGLALQLALAGLAAVLVGGGWLGWNQRQQQPTFSQSLATARGQQLSAELPEHSRLRLDTATQLDVALYRHQRELRLTRGRAMFEVQPDPSRPFHVLAGPLRISVLGTRFSVGHAPDGAGQVQVVVEEGRVRVAPADTAAEAVELSAGQAVQADAQGRLSAVTTVPLGAALAWRSGRVVLSDLPLGEAVREFERYVDTGLLIRDPAVAALRLNGSFDLRQTEAFKRALPQVLPVRLQARPDGRTEVLPANGS